MVFYSPGGVVMTSQFTAHNVITKHIIRAKIEYRNTKLDFISNADYTNVLQPAGSGCCYRPTPLQRAISNTTGNPLLRRFLIFN